MDQIEDLDPTAEWTFGSTDEEGDPSDTTHQKRSRLRLASDLLLPASLAGGRVAVLGRTGSGKSTTARTFVEEVIRTGRTVLVIDPMGSWRGLREAADGGPGLPVLVAGHASDDDLATDEPELVASAVHRGASVVVDLSALRTGALVRAATAVLDELYQTAGDHPVLVVIEEADELAPQQPSLQGQHDSLQSVERLARRGRGRGIGLLVISQRSAAIAKGVLSQVDLLIAFASPSPQDRRAIASWVATDTPREREMLAGIGSLATGEALVWDPRANRLSRHRMARPWTAEHRRSADVPPDGGPVDRVPGPWQPLAPVALPSGSPRTPTSDTAGTPTASSHDPSATRGRDPVAAPLELPEWQLSMLADLIVDRLWAVAGPVLGPASEPQTVEPVFPPAGPQDLPSADPRHPSPAAEPPLSPLAARVCDLLLDLGAVSVDDVAGAIDEPDPGRAAEAIAEAVAAGRASIDSRVLRPAAR